jgi:DNA-binding MarR family transcriptional regulator
MAPTHGVDSKLLHKVSLLMSTLRQINPTMSIQVVHTLMLIALHEGASVTEIAKMSGFKLPTVSRNILDLGKQDRRRQPGLGLVETKVDPMELRKKQVALTPKGQDLLRQIIDIMKV